jgi:hypothetical protein
MSGEDREARERPHWIAAAPASPAGFVVLSCLGSVALVGALGGLGLMAHDEVQVALAVVAVLFVAGLVKVFHGATLADLLASGAALRGRAASAHRALALVVLFLVVLAFVSWSRRGRMSW